MESCVSMSGPRASGTLELAFGGAHVGVERPVALFALPVERRQDSPARDVVREPIVFDLLQAALQAGARHLFRIEHPGAVVERRERERERIRALVENGGRKGSRPRIAVYAAAVGSGAARAAGGATGADDPRRRGDEYGTAERAGHIDRGLEETFARRRGHDHRNGRVVVDVEVGNEQWPAVDALARRFADRGPEARD